MNKTVLVLLACVLCVCSTQAAISFGSKEATIELTSGSFSFSEDGVGLTKGTLRTAGAGSFSGDTGESLTCSNMRIQTSHTSTQKAMRVDGALSLFDATLSLANNEVLTVDGGQVAETVTVNGAAATPSMIRGNGSFASGISVNATRELVMRWEGELHQDLTLTSSAAGTTKVTLEEDLRFGHGFSVEASSETGTAEVDFNNFAMTVGEVTIGTNNQQWRDAWLKLSGDTTISAEVTLVGRAAHIEGHGHTLSLTGATAGSVDGTISNVTLGSFGAGVLACTGIWTLSQVTLDDGSQRIHVPYGALTGGTADVFAGNATWPSATLLEMQSDTDLSGEWEFTAASKIEGNGSSINFSDTSSIIDYNGTLTMSDVTLTNIVKESFDNGGAQDLHLSSVEWHDAISNGGGSVRINASPVVDNARYAQLSLASGSAGEDGALFDDTTGDTDRIVWNNGVGLELLSNVDLNTTWTFDGASAINGHGYTINLEGGTLDYNADLYLNDITLVGLDAAAFDNELDNDLYLANVAMIDDATGGTIRVSCNAEVSPQGAAQVSLATSNSGSIFATGVTWDNGVNIEVLKQITFSGSGAWTFTDDSIIRGNGNVIDFNSIAAPMTVAAGKTLSISNATILGWGNGEIVLGAAAVLELSDVTIVMDNNYSTDLTGETIRINGGCKIITGGFTFDAANGSNEINGVTLWYDSLGRQDQTFVKMGAFTGGGKVQMIPLNEWQDIIFDIDADYMVNSTILDYDVTNGSLTYLGRNVTFSNLSAFTFKGGGRSFYLNRQPGSGASITKLISVTGDNANTVELTDITIDGWSPSHITDSNDLIRYGNGAVMRLREDVTMTSKIYVSNATSGDTVVLDLNGHEIDFDSDDSGFDIAATDVNLIIKNGRIMNLNDNGSTTKFLTNSGTTSTVTFQDCDIFLNGAARMLANNVSFKGRCTLAGTADATLTCYGTDITIEAGAWLTVEKGMTLAMQETNSTISFGSQNATLELFGATLDTQNVSPFSLTGGTLRIDDIATLAGTMTLGGSGSAELEVDIQPSASIEVTTGTITYANDS